MWGSIDPSRGFPVTCFFIYCYLHFLVLVQKSPQAPCKTPKKYTMTFIYDRKLNSSIQRRRNLLLASSTECNFQFASALPVNTY